MPYLGNRPTATPIQSSDLADGIVTNAKLGTDISAAKLTAGTLPDARFPATLPALNGTNLTNVGELNTPCFYATMSAHQNLSDNISAKVEFNQTSFATTGTYDTSNYRFTPGVAGIYQFHICVVGDSQATANLYAHKVYLFKNGSSISHQSDGVTFNFVDNYARQAPITHNLTDTSDADDYYEVYVQVNDTTSNPRAFRYGSYFSAFRIGSSA